MLSSSARLHEYSPGKGISAMIKLSQMFVLILLSLTISLIIPSNSPGQTQINRASSYNLTLICSTQAFFPQDTSTDQSIKEYAIQVGAFAKKKNAERLQQRIQTDGYRVDVYENLIDGKRLFYLVWVGVYRSEEEAQPDLTVIKSKFDIDGVIRPRTISRR
jgi:hypothetical protein